METPQNHPTIALIEDDASISNMYKLKFEHDQMVVKTAEDGQTGLALVLQSHPDVIILDLMMPTMNGIEFIGKLRQYPEFDKTHIIVLTNMDNSATEEEVKNLGISDFYVKAEVTPQQISDRIKEYRHEQAVKKQAK